VTPGSLDQGPHEENLLAEAKKVGVKRIVKLSGKIADHHTIGFSQWNGEAERRIKRERHFLYHPAPEITSCRG
jgi:hypothetical protein